MNTAPFSKFAADNQIVTPAQPVANETASVLLFEPASTRATDSDISCRISLAAPEERCARLLTSVPHAPSRKRF